MLFELFYFRGISKEVEIMYIFEKQKTFRNYAHHNFHKRSNSIVDWKLFMIS